MKKGKMKMPIKTARLSEFGRNFKISEHFTLGEFASKDGADLVKYSTDLLMMLEELRRFGGFTIEINSGYRSAAHNRAVGGASNSQHVKGTAADITVKKDGKVVDAALICCLCQMLDFPGIAYISPRSVHADARLSGTYRGDERKNYRNNVSDFFAYFGIKKTEIEALKINKKSEENDMTKEEVKSIVYEVIAEMMTKKASEPPADWSKDAREWAKTSDIIKGTEKGDEWKSPVDREQLTTIIYRVMQKIDPIK